MLLRRALLEWVEFKIVVLQFWLLLLLLDFEQLVFSCLEIVLTLLTDFKNLVMGFGRRYVLSAARRNVFRSISFIDWRLGGLHWAGFAAVPLLIDAPVRMNTYNMNRVLLAQRPDWFEHWVLSRKPSWDRVGHCLWFRSSSLRSHLLILWLLLLLIELIHRDNTCRRSH